MALKEIPRFKNEQEEADFWATHDSTEYLNWKIADKKRMAKSLHITQESVSYAKGYYVGRIELLRGLIQRLREDEELRTLAGLQEVLLSLLEDQEAERQKLLYANQE